jgi:DNA-binding transcriptional ArsR family regulator
MATEDFKHQLFDQFARVGKTVCHGRRLELLEVLAQGERTVEVLAQLCGLSMANTSQHLRQLRQAGLVSSRKEGQHVYYSITDPEVVALVALVRRIAERHLAEVDRLIRSYLAVKDQLEPVSRPELLRRARQGSVTVVDLRPRDNHEIGRIPGAIDISLEELEARLGEVRSDRETVAHCRGPYCLLAYETGPRVHGPPGRPARLPPTAKPGPGRGSIPTRDEQL